jgi:chromosome segregation ATPase
MHLLVETALGDSQYFQTLSVEEVEALKQEQRALDGRLGTLRTKLEAETKIRDAARSLNRLSSRKSKGHTRGINSRGSNAVQDPAARSEEELIHSNQKVEDLARELVEVESRMRVIDTQLLMHTASVLQLTHQGPAKRHRNSQGGPGVQRPDSPVSLDTYDTDGRARNKKDDEFDERSFYRSAENLDSLMDALQNGTHTHLPPREQNSEALGNTAKRIEEINARVRQLIVQANPERNRDYSMPPRLSSSEVDGSAVDEQLDFLDQCISDFAVESQHGHASSKESVAAAAAHIDGMNNQLYAMLSRTDESTLAPPPINEDEPQEQLNYMEGSLQSIQQMHFSMSEQLEQLRSQADIMAREMDELRSQTSNNQSEQYEATLTGLWSIIQAGEEDARQRKRQRREMLAASGDNDEELSPDEDYDPNEQFSLNAFSAKVQWLSRRVAMLKEKQSILTRQIKQQRELNSRSDAQKEEQFEQLKEQLLSARSEKASVEKELERAVGQLRVFDEGKTESDSQDLKDAQERIESLQIQLNEAQDDARVEAAAMQAELSQASSRIEEITVALSTATAEKEAAGARALEANNNLNAKEAELRDLEGEVVRLTTELTFAKAELDGAYGTRAERAAESGAPIKRELEELGASNAALLTEIEILKKAHDAASRSEAEARESEKTLKQELLGMTADYEALTRDLIQNEKDRDMLEASIDKLRDDKESLELELSDERVKWLGIRSPAGAPNGTPGSTEATSIRMLREDFRKMMRDRTAEGLRALRVSLVLHIR